MSTRSEKSKQPRLQLFLDERFAERRRLVTGSLEAESVRAGHRDIGVKTAVVDRDVFRNWKLYVAHSILPDGQTVVDFGDIWEGPVTRAHKGADYPRVYPGGRLRPPRFDEGTLALDAPESMTGAETAPVGTARGPRG